MSVKDILRAGIESVSDEQIDPNLAPISEEETIEVFVDTSDFKSAKRVGLLSDALSEEESDEEPSEKEQELRQRLINLVLEDSPEEAAFVAEEPGTEGIGDFFGAVTDKISGFFKNLRRNIASLMDAATAVENGIEDIKAILEGKGDKPLNKELIMSSKLIRFLSDPEMNNLDPKTMDRFVKYMESIFDPDPYYSYAAKHLELTLNYFKAVIGEDMSSEEYDKVWDKEYNVPFTKFVNSLHSKYNLKPSKYRNNRGRTILMSDVNMGFAEMRATKPDSIDFARRSMSFATLGSAAPGFHNEAYFIENGKTILKEDAKQALTRKELMDTLKGLEKLLALLKKAKTLESTMKKSEKVVEDMMDQLQKTDFSASMKFGIAQDLRAEAAWLASYASNNQVNILAHLASVGRAAVIALKNNANNLEAK